MKSDETTSTSPKWGSKKNRKTGPNSDRKQAIMTAKLSKRHRNQGKPLRRVLCPRCGKNSVNRSSPMCAECKTRENLRASGYTDAQIESTMKQQLMQRMQRQPSKTNKYRRTR